VVFDGFGNVHGTSPSGGFRLSTTSGAESAAPRVTCSNGAVAWCTHCNKFLTPPTVTPDGNCPRCGEPVERGLIPGMTRSPDEPDPAVPWHLKLLGSALAIYLGYRFLQLIDWVFHH
jgi:hypothetical protein